VGGITKGVGDRDASGARVLVPGGVVFLFSIAIPPIAAFCMTICCPNETELKII
jgi:hypothetical protein